MRLFLLLLAGVFSLPALAAERCASDSFDTTAVIASVHDGDSLRLADGRKLRLIGINAPELARDGRAAQPLASEAGAALRAMLAPGTPVKLVFEQEKQDKYGRTLAHVFGPEGGNIQARLLGLGLATAITVPPNDRFSACYRRAERLARCELKGIWSHVDYAVHMAPSLTLGDTGFRRVRGLVTRVHRSKQGDLWLTLDKTVHVHIRKRDRDNFEPQALARLKNTHVTVRGWLHRNKSGDGFYMALRHPAALNSAAAEQCP